MVSASLSIVWKRPSHLGSTGRPRLPLPAVTGGPQAELFLEDVQLVRELAWLHSFEREEAIQGWPWKL